MRKLTTIFALLALALALLCAPPAIAGEFCLHAHQAEPSSSSGCYPMGVTTATGPHVVMRCGNTFGAPGEQMYWNLTLPPDVPNDMTVDTIGVYWGKGTATTGNGCWLVYFHVIKDGQDYADVTYPSAWVVAPESIPSTTLVKLSDGFGGGNTDFEDVTESACSSAPDNCRLAPLRVVVNRQNNPAGCSSNADGDIDFYKVCFTY